MKKYEIVKEHHEFDNIIQTGKYKKNAYYVIYNKESKNNFPRFGIAVGKKVGHAVTRNKLKRQVRMIINNNKNIFKNNRDYIIIVKKSVMDISFDDMTKKLLELI